MTRCDGDSFTFARFIDTEAEVDEDLSDDDEAEIDDNYDRYSPSTACVGLFFLRRGWAEVWPHWLELAVIGWYLAVIGP